MALLHAPRSPSQAETQAPLGREGALEVACPLLERPGPRGGQEEGRNDMTIYRIDEAAREKKTNTGKKTRKEKHPNRQEKAREAVTLLQ